MKAINLNIHGIQCDNSACDYRDESVEYRDYKKWLNKPCPMCGANLLTSKDLMAIKKLTIISDIINFFIKPKKDAETVTVKAEMNGSRRINFKF